MSFSDMKTSILSAVVVPILVLSSSTVTPFSAESAVSKDIASITSSDKVKPSTASKEASDRSSLEILSNRVEKTENSINDLTNSVKDLTNSVKDLTKGLDEVKSDLRGTIVLFVVVSILLFIRSEFNNNEMKEEMKRNKAEFDAEMAKADAKMDRNLIITNSISATSLLISLISTLATNK
jgi:hypothetical protein